MPIESEKIIVATTADERYFKGLAVTVLSALVSAGPSASIFFHVFDTGLSAASRELLVRMAKRVSPNVEIRFVPVSLEMFRGLTCDHGGGHSTYVRLLVGSLVDASRMLYIDSDMLVLADLATPWRMPMQGNIVLACPDVVAADGSPNRLSYDCPFLSKELADAYVYHNCGFLVIDLDAWRAADCETMCIDAARGHKGDLKAWDQTILNYVLRGKIGAIDGKFCRSVSWQPVEDGSIQHYVSRAKPWNFYGLMPAYRLWYGFYKEFVEAELPLALPWKTRMRGLVLFWRQYIFATQPWIGSWYCGRMRARGRLDQARLFAAALAGERDCLPSGLRMGRQQLEQYRRVWVSSAGWIRHAGKEERLQS